MEKKGVKKEITCKRRGMVIDKKLKWKEEKKM